MRGAKSVKKIAGRERMMIILERMKMDLIFKGAAPAIGYSL
jgi:hypothetical protein